MGIFLFLIFALLVVYLFFRFLWAIAKPLFTYMYDSIVKCLQNTGLEEDAAKAVISFVVLIVIIFFFF